MKLVPLALLAALAAQAQTPDAAFQKFWAADSPAAAARAASDIEKSKITFDEALTRLKAGHTYSAQKTGIVQGKNRTSGNSGHFYSIHVPAWRD